MPKGKGYDSEAQRRFFHTEAAREAGITQADVDKRDKESKGKHLPERAGEKDHNIPHHAQKKVHHSPTMLQVDCQKIHELDPYTVKEE